MTPQSCESNGILRKFEDTPLSMSAQFETALDEISAFHAEKSKTHKNFRTLVIVRFDRDTGEVRITTCAHEPWEYMDTLMSYVPKEEFDTRLKQALREVVLFYEMRSIKGGTVEFTEATVQGSDFLYAVSEVSSLTKDLSPIMGVVFSPQDVNGDNWHVVHFPHVPEPELLTP